MLVKILLLLTFLIISQPAIAHGGCPRSSDLELGLYYWCSFALVVVLLLGPVIVGVKSAKLKDRMKRTVVALLISIPYLLMVVMLNVLSMAGCPKFYYFSITHFFIAIGFYFYFRQIIKIDVFKMSVFVFVALELFVLVPVGLIVISSLLWF